MWIWAVFWGVGGSGGEGIGCILEYLIYPPICILLSYMEAAKLRIKATTGIRFA